MYNNFLAQLYIKVHIEKQNLILFKKKNEIVTTQLNRFRELRRIKKPKND